jgi:hypothetical protein
MARMWVVARYEDEGEHDSLRNQADELRKEGESGFFFLLEDNNPILANSKRLAEYSYLLSLFLHTQPQYYDGESFILDIDSHQFSGDSEISQYVPLSFLHFGMVACPHLMIQ